MPTDTETIARLRAQLYAVDCLARGLQVTQQELKKGSYGHSSAYAQVARLRQTIEQLNSDLSEAEENYRINNLEAHRLRQIIADLEEEIKDGWMESNTAGGKIIAEQEQTIAELRQQLLNRELRWEEGEEFRQLAERERDQSAAQLKQALAALEQKDAVLRSVGSGLDAAPRSFGFQPECDRITAALAIKPDASALAKHDAEMVDIFTKSRLRWTRAGALLIIAALPLQFLNARLAFAVIACSNVIAWVSLYSVYKKLQTPCSPTAEAAPTTQTNSSA